MVTLGSLMTRILSKKVEPKTPVEKVLYGQFKRVTLDTTLSKVSRILDRDHYCLVVHNQRLCKHFYHRIKQQLSVTKMIKFWLILADSNADGVEERTVVIGIVTQIDLLNYITSHTQI